MKITRILIGLIVGAVLALVCPSQSWIGMFGTIFVGALKALAPILVFILVAAALSRAGAGLGKKFTYLVCLYLATTVVAAMLAFFTGTVFPVSLTLNGAESAVDASAGSLSEVFSGMLASIVQNPVSALIQANYLSILFWAILAGLSLRYGASDSTKAVIGDLADAVSKCIKWVILCAPFGIMGLVFTSVSTGGLSIFTEYGRLLLCLVGCMLVSMLVVNPAFGAFVMRRNPYPLLWRCLKESAVPAFFTRSSAANIPVNMQLCEKEGVDRDFYSVAVPLGSTINMNGAAITITLMTLATCTTVGVEVGVVSAMILCLLSTAAACGSSGVAGGSLLLIPMACSLFGISQDISMQVVGIGFIIGVVQDSMETALNSSSDAFFVIATEMRHRLKG